MVNQSDAMARLNKEKDYEDHLVDVLTAYLLNSLPEIKDIGDEKKKIIYEKLDIIRTDSIRHSAMFNNLVQMVLENGEGNY